MRRELLGVARADVRERVRSRTILVVPMLAASLGAVLSGDGVNFVVGSYTGEPTAAWVGGVMALAGTAILCVAGYFPVDGAIERDRRTGVGTLISTSSTSDTAYLLGKWLGNVALLAVVTGVLFVATVGTFLVRGRGPFDLVALTSPFLLVTLPAAALVAAVALLFETIGLLRGALGSVLYFLGAISAMTASAVGIGPVDPFALQLFKTSMEAAIAAEVPGFGGAVTFGFTAGSTAPTTFTWPGIRWTTAQLADRAALVGIAVALVGVATITFDRFVSAAGRADDDNVDAPVADRERDVAVNRSFAPVTERGSGSGGRLLIAELRLALKGRRWWWYVALAALVVAGVVADAETARSLVLPVAWLLPLPVWSALGVRERRHRTTDLVFTSRRPLGQLGAAWLAGVLVAALAGSGVAAGLALAGQPGGLLAWVAGALFVPSLALACGVWLGTARAFEVVYLGIWYLGPLNGVIGLDFTGSVPGSVEAGVPFAYLAAAAALTLAGVAGRIRRLRR